ncbi:MAG: hypothetical protein ACRBBW_13130 [Cellvibrionaceae bacterium]
MQQQTSFSPTDDDGLMSESLITVPDEVSGIVLAEEEQAEEPPIFRIMEMAKEGGREVLTDEELALLEEFESQAQEGDGGNHNANLAEYVEETELSRLASDVIQWVKWDEDSRADWYKRERKGIQALGLTSKTDRTPPFPGASQATHPVLAEAIVQFQARAMESLWPAGGPVKTVVLGDATEEKKEQSKRVEQFLNYQYSELMPGAYEQTDKMLTRLPLSGSCFIKASVNEKGKVYRSFVEPADFIVSYNAEDLETAPRYTERVRLTPNNMKKLQLQGFYRDCNLSDPTSLTGTEDRETVTDAIDATEGTSQPSADANTNMHVVYECVCTLNLQGFEHRDEEGRETGLELEYIVSVERDSQKVVAIRRNWRPGDPDQGRIVYHTHYRFMSGLGFYGYGLYHWIGGLADAATGSLRALLDSAQFANMQGGHRAKDAKMVNGDQPLKPGEWREVDVDAEDLAKAFHRVPYKEPSGTLFSLLGHLENLAQRFASTTEAMIGDGAQNTPVGTILARIEQGTKIHTSIQKRLHRAAKNEFKLVSWLNSIYLPEKYPYDVVGGEQSVGRADFDSRVDVLPVSDPNYASNIQRYFMAQATLELADKAPHLYDMQKIHKRVLESLKVDGLDEILPDTTEKPKRMGPVEEGASALVGKPITSYIDQAHEAHIAIHQQLLANLGGDHPAAAKLQAHIQEHMAMSYVLRMQQMTGVPFTMPGEEEEGQEQQEEMPLEMENQIAMQTQQAIQEMQAQAQQGEAAPDPEQQARARKAAQMVEDERMKDEAVSNDIKRKQAKHEAEQTLKHDETTRDLSRKIAAKEAEIMSGRHE